MPLRPRFRRALKILILVGLVPLGILYFEGFIEPHIDLANFPHPPRRGCPVFPWLHPLSHQPIQPTDSLELSLLGDPSVDWYTITLHGDGTLTRDTTYTMPGGLKMGCPLHDADKHMTISSNVAKGILTKARDGGFCRLCQFYQPTRAKPDDPPGQQLTLTLSGKTNTVYNWAGKAPAIFHELTDDILPLAPIPDYALRSNDSRERQQECSDFSTQEINKMARRLNLPPLPERPKPNTTRD